MNQQSLTFVGFSLAAFVFAACGDDPKTSGGSVEDQEIIAISDKTISGVSQKGPFVNGSSVTVQELDGETFAQTGDSYEGKIKNDLGEFSVKVAKLASQYALLKANGFYRNEVTGEKSKSQVTLYALTDLSDRDEVNVNLLTHLAYERSLYLATGKDSLSVSDAKKQAEAEVLKTFGIEGDFAAAEDLNIFGENDQSAALLAVSVLMQGNLSEGDFSERLANYAADIESDGIWNDSRTATKIADWANSQGLGSGLLKIRENITKWDLSADVPSFEKYVNNFWWQNYGLGTCDKRRESEVLKNQNSASANAGEYYICKSNSWQEASDLEKDTYKWATGKDAEVKYGDVVKENCYVFEDKAWRVGNKLDCSLDLRGCTALRQDAVGEGSDKVWHICDAKTWRNATTYEKDTFGWKDSTDGAIKKGNVTDTIYVFDKTTWRVTSAVEGKHGGCVAAIADSVGKVGSTYYICKSNKWVEASAIEYDTYRWTAGKDGDSKAGSVNASNCYVFEDKAWRSGNSSDCSLGLRGCTKLRQDSVGKGSDKVWHICDAKTWRNTTTYEKDTFGWKDSTDGAIKKGNVTDTIYVFDKTKWRETSNVEAKLGGCVTAIADSVGKVGSTYYICKSGSWTTATALEYDTYKWSAGKDGDSKIGSVNAGNCYVYEDKVWRSGNANDCSLGLRGCTTLRQDTVGLGSDNVWRICDAKSWRNASNIEKDTATWGAGSFDGEVRAGQVNTSVYYIYGTLNHAWRNATTLEKDTYDYTNNMDWRTGTDGEIKKGSVTDSVYVYDASAWRTADDIEKELGGCVAAVADSVGKVGSTYYICVPRKWVVAVALQYDTYKKECLTDGSIVDGNVISSNKYVCDGGAFRAATEEDLRAGLGCTNYTRGEFRILSGQYSYYKCGIDGWTFTIEKLNQGTMTDERDGNEYKVIGVGNQMWLAENLKFYVEQGVCKESSADSCAKYGIFYKWTTLMDIDEIYDDEYAVDNLVYPHKGICPDGWHIPQRKEWQTLENFVASHIADNSEENLPKHLIADDWIVSDDKKTKKGLNTFGLGILPYDGGSYAWYHSSDEHTSYGHGTIVFGFDISYYSYSSSGFLGKGSFFPVRCVKD